MSNLREEENSMYEVTITGFKNKESAQMFMDWYEGQGEQDIQIWADCRKEEGEPILNNFLSTTMNYNKLTFKVD